MKKRMNKRNINYMNLRKMVINLNTITGCFKIVLAIASKSLLFLIYAFYNIGISLAKRTSIKESKKHQYDNYFLCGLIVFISSMIYVTYSIYIYFNGSSVTYHSYIAISIAALSFYNITVAIIGIIKAKKHKNIQLETMKLTNFASALISMSLTQTAILSFAQENDLSKYNALGGIMFGVLASIVGLYMIGYTIYVKQKKMMEQNKFKKK